jgi:hypothetical protein
MTTQEKVAQAKQDVAYLEGKAATLTPKEIFQIMENVENKNSVEIMGLILTRDGQGFVIGRNWCPWATVPWTIYRDTKEKVSVNERKESLSYCD